MALDLKVYTASATGADSGSYSSAFTSQRSANLTLQRDLFAGESLRIDAKRSNLDSNLQKPRPIRLYNGSVKLFDGFIKPSGNEYQFKGNNKNNFSAVGVSWDKELAGIVLSDADQVSYVGQTIDYILTDLCRLANIYGMVKKSEYKYDITQLPFYDAEVFGTTVSVDFTGKTILTALQDMGRFLDIYETNYSGEWTVRINALIDDSYIYIIPMMTDVVSISIFNFGTFLVGTGFTDGSAKPALTGSDIWIHCLTNVTTDTVLHVWYTDELSNSYNIYSPTIPAGTLSGSKFKMTLAVPADLANDITAVTVSGGATAGNQFQFTDSPSSPITNSSTFQNFQIGNKVLSLDYDRIVNYCEVTSGGGRSAYIRTIPGYEDTTQILTEQTFTTGINPDNQPAALRYMRLKIKNTTGTDMAGQVILYGTTAGGSGQYDYLYCRIPPNSTKFYFTNKRFSNIISFSHNFASDPTMTVDEFNLSVAGKSINKFGMRAKLISRPEIGSLPDTALADSLTWTTSSLEVTGLYSANHDEVQPGDFIKLDADGTYYAVSYVDGMDSVWLVTAFTGTTATGASTRRARSLATYYAEQQVRTYHAPIVECSFDLFPDIVSFVDLIGQRITVYDEIEAVNRIFMCVGLSYQMRGVSVRESLKLMRYNTDWEYEL